MRESLIRMIRNKKYWFLIRWLHRCWDIENFLSLNIRVGYQHTEDVTNTKIPPTLSSQRHDDTNMSLTTILGEDEIGVKSG